MIRSNRTAAALALALATLVGCNGGNGDDLEMDRDGMTEARAGWPAGLSERMDSGNVAYRAGRYDEAAEVFRRATDQAPDVAATWFGLHMAESARGNEAAADSALMQAEALTPGLGQGHPGMEPGEGLPPGHPTMPGEGMPPGDSPAPALPEGHPPIQ